MLLVIGVTPRIIFAIFSCLCHGPFTEIREFCLAVRLGHEGVNNVQTNSASYGLRLGPCSLLGEGGAECNSGARGRSQKHLLLATDAISCDDLLLIHTSPPQGCSQTAPSYRTLPRSFFIHMHIKLPSRPDHLPQTIGDQSDKRGVHQSHKRRASLHFATHVDYFMQCMCALDVCPVSCSMASPWHE